MSIPNDIYLHCQKKKKPLTAKQIVEDLYPDKTQPYVNGHINKLVDLGMLARDDSAKPYTVTVSQSASIPNTIYQYCKKTKKPLTAKQIVDELYPGKSQPYVNGHINELVDEGLLERDDKVKPYTVIVTPTKGLLKRLFG